MTMMDLKGKTEKNLEELESALWSRDNMVGASAVHNFRKFYGKMVTVIKGRKVPHGTTGECFWMGIHDYSKYGDPWGIYTSTRIGIRTDSGEVFWTDLNNVTLFEAQSA